ncbi:MAG: M23 family metallopeptidase, partial [Chloroflexota bacterium]|nr:M23 family metallopeptidase [Chloroflexota bacterium]
PFWGEPAAWYNGVWYPHFHNGLDIAAPMYTPIRAPAAGRVVTVGKPYLAWGDTAEIVIIAHGGNFSTLYGHLDDSARPPVVSVGQWVRAGQLIGYVGMTGWTTGPHLHFMTIVDGHAQNPLSYLPPR